MENNRIQKAVQNVIQYYTENPDKGIAADKPATATVESGLRCRAIGGNGAELVSDMPKGIGGDASAPSPGWLMRAALANCEATMLALRAAELGITLTTIEVTVGSTSDDRGLLQINDSIPAGPLNIRIHIKLGGENVSKEQLQDLVSWTERHSPVGDALHRAVPILTSLAIV